MLGIIGAFCCLLYALICWLTGDTTSTWMALTVGVVCLLLTVRHMSASTPASQPTPHIDWSRQPYRVDSMPTGPADPFYGYDDANAALDGCRARIHGTPGFGLAGSGLEQGRTVAGIMGERSLACALRYYGLLDDPDLDVFFSLRNPGDGSGRADIDCVLAKGNLILLLDAKRYTPSTSDLMLMPSVDDPMFASGPVGLRVLSHGLLEGRDTIGALSDLTPVCEYSASGNMRWAVESTRRLLPGCTVGAWVLLTRTPHGTFGVSDRTLFPGGISVVNADVRLPLLRDMLSRESGRNATVCRTLDALVKR